MKKYLLALTLLSSSIFAGGYSIMEYSVTNLGRAFAGAGLVGDDYSAIAFNPAGMTLLGSGFQAGVHGVLLDGEVDATVVSKQGSKKQGSTGIYNQNVLPHFFGQRAVGNWRFGLGIYSPLGLEITYQHPDWVGCDHSISSKVVDVAFAPTVAYHLNKYLSMGVGLYAEYLSAKLTNTIGGCYSELEADGVAWGVNLGLMIQPCEYTKIGISYRSQNVKNLQGKHRMFGVKTGTASTHLTGPAQLFLALSQKLTERVDFLFSAKWTKWDCFSALDIHSSIVPVIIHVEENWRNVWTFAVGMNYRFNECWTVRLGSSIDQTPVPNAKYRTARIPDSNRLMLTTGLSYAYKNYQFDLGYAHLFMNKAEIDNANSFSTLKAKVEAKSNVIAAAFQYRF